MAIQSPNVSEQPKRIELEEKLDQLYGTLDETERGLRSLLGDADAALRYLSELVKEALHLRQEIRRLIRRIRTLYKEPVQSEGDPMLQS